MITQHNWNKKLPHVQSSNQNPSIRKRNQFKQGTVASQQTRLINFSSKFCLSGARSSFLCLFSSLNEKATQSEALVNIWMVHLCLVSLTYMTNLKVNWYITCHQFYFFRKQCSKFDLKLLLSHFSRFHHSDVPFISLILLEVWIEKGNSFIS